MVAIGLKNIMNPTWTSTTWRLQRRECGLLDHFNHSYVGDIDIYIHGQ